MNKNRTIKTWFLSVAMITAFFAGSNFAFGQGIFTKTNAINQEMGLAVVAPNLRGVLTIGNIGGGSLTNPSITYGLNTTRVGIGTNGPSESLDVNGNGRFRNIPTGIGSFMVTGLANGTLRKINFTGSATDVLKGNGTFGPVGGGGGVTLSCGTDNYLTKRFGANNLVCSQIFDNGTFVGIGTTSPSEKLQIGEVTTCCPGNSATNRNALYIPSAWSEPDLTSTTLGDKIIFFNGGGWKTAIGMSTNNAVWFQTHPDAGTAAYKFFASVQNTAPIERVTIMENGNVGIGVSNPSHTLEVAGEIFATGLVYCNSVALCSDVRYKKDIKPLKNSLQNVMNLKGMDYYFKTDEFADKKFSTGKQLGFIAQEMEQVYPELVLTDAKGYKSVNYVGIIPVLTEAIKEQQTIIDEKNKKVENLEKDLNEMKEQMAQLSSRLTELCNGQIPISGKTTGSSLNNINEQQQGTILNQNNPNPFNNSTVISYKLSQAGNVELKVYDVNGRLVKTIVNAYQDTGDYTYNCCEGEPLPTGAYSYTLKTDGAVLQKKAIVIK